MSSDPPPPAPSAVSNDGVPTLHAIPGSGALLFNRYRCLRELGRGGMGVVYLAHDELLEIEVALKLIPEQIVRDVEGIQELKREVLRGIALTHRNVVRVHSFEQDADSGAVVMEYVDGETLSTLKSIQPGRCFDPQEIRPWLDQLCAVLDYAHQEAKIAHRDLKPQNILLTRDGRIKVADFGISTSLSDTMQRISGRGNAAGTPPYMSPQQVLGEKPSHLDDIYSLGATLFELIAGKPPFFRGNIPVQVLQEAPPTMAVRRKEIGASGNAIPDVWERAVAACLAKESAARPQSGQAVLDLIDSKTGSSRQQRLKSPMELLAQTTPASEHPITPKLHPIVEPPRVATGPRQWRPLGRRKRGGALKSFVGRSIGAILAGAITAAIIHVFPVRSQLVNAIAAHPSPAPTTPAPTPAPPTPRPTPVETRLQPARGLEPGPPGPIRPSHP